MSEPQLGEAVDPDDAFSTLSNATRLDILEALWETEHRRASFSELREAVGMRDSGQFNYHLSELRDHFVGKDGDDYYLKQAGIQVVGAVLAGTYTRTGVVDPVPMDEPCPSCGGQLTFEYDDECASVDCADCDITSRFNVPAGVFAGYPAAEFPAVAERYARVTVRQVGTGFCWYCEGRTEPTVRTLDADEEASLPERFEAVPFVQFDCERCGEDLVVDLGGALHEHPLVVSFFADHGVDVREKSFWTFSAIAADRASVASRDPFRAAVSFVRDDERLTLTVDRSLTVRESTREAR